MILMVLRVKRVLRVFLIVCWLNFFSQFAACKTAHFLEVGCSDNVHFEGDFRGSHASAAEIEFQKSPVRWQKLKKWVTFQPSKKHGQTIMFFGQFSTFFFIFWRNNYVFHWVYGGKMPRWPCLVLGCYNVMVLKSGI